MRRGAAPAPPPPAPPPRRSRVGRRAMNSLDDLTLAEAIAALDHPRTISTANTAPLTRNMGIASGAFIKPDGRVLRGLARMGILTGTNAYNPDLFDSEIVNRHAALPAPLSFESIAYNAWSDIHNSGPNSRISLFKASDNSLMMPLNDVYNLPTAIFIYILEMIQSQTDAGHEYTVFYSLEPENFVNNVESRIGFLDRTGPNPNLVPYNQILDIYNSIMGAIYVLFTGYNSSTNPATWTGSEESGLRIMLLNRGKVSWRLKLFFHDGHVVAGAQAWNKSIAVYLDAKFPQRCYFTVSNTSDTECLLYMTVLGIMVELKEYWMVNQPKILDPATIRTRGMYYSRNPVVQNISKQILEKSDDMPDIEMLKSTNKISVTRFREQMQIYEDWVFKSQDKSLDGFGLDVYILDEGLSKHIYPVFMSKRAGRAGANGRHIKLLSVQYKEGGHYLLITDMRTIMKNTSGKIFYNCSICNQSFFTRAALMSHICLATLAPDALHWSRYDLPLDTPADQIKGTCSKCMLKFKTDFEAYFHKNHCLMEGRTGYRYVHCIPYKDCRPSDDHCPLLKGVSVDLEKEEAQNNNCRLLFADFESSIDPHTGKHNMMSYGLYDMKTDYFEIKYTMDDLMESLYNYACEDRKILVYFHNAMNYDANFILRYVLSTEWTQKWNIQTIMKSSSRLQKLTFTFSVDTPDGKKEQHTIEIGDTFLFLTLSLEKIVGCIRSKDFLENTQKFKMFFREFKRAYPWVSDMDINDILKKNLFPYKYFTSPERLDSSIEEFLAVFEPKPENLPYFSETVVLEDLDEQYPFISSVVEKFHCMTARDYHDIYLRCDVMQLADVFTNAIHTLWESHHVFLPNYIGMPGASWAAFLRHDPTMEIPLYTNTIYAEFFSSMTRGGVTSAPLRYAKADETHSIIYLDVNGLYPYVMQGYKYPCGYLAWVNFSYADDEDPQEILMTDVFPTLERNGEGMCITVDLHYTRELKDKTDDYPFAPEHRLIYDQYFGEENQFLREWEAANLGEDMKPFKGLVGTLYDKKQYTCHWRLLKWYIEHGLQVTKLYWGVKFQEGEYLAGYVRKNIEIRNKCKDELRKMVYKLLGNSIYGKTFESPFRRGKYIIIPAEDEDKLRGMISEGHVVLIMPIDDIGWVVKIDGEEIVLDKPTYIGACVVEYAKLHMYKLLYDDLKSIFSKVQLVYTDTDSFIVMLEHPPELHDPTKLFAYIKSVKPDLIGGIGGQVKSETGEDDTIDEIIALRSKVYAYKTVHGHIGKRAKGTTHAAQEMQLDWEAYKQVLETRVSKETTNVQFIRTKFSISTINAQRQSLSANDGKRFICEDGIHTHAWGFLDDEI